MLMVNFVGYRNVCFENCRHMHYRQLVDNQVEAREYIYSYGTQRVKKGAVLLSVWTKVSLI